MPRVRFSQPASIDLRDLLAYISRRSPAGARRLGDAILQRIELLEDHPRLGTFLGTTGSNEYRQLVVGNVVIRYRIESSGTVRIASIQHGARVQPNEETLEGRLEEEDN